MKRIILLAGVAAMAFVLGRFSDADPVPAQQPKQPVIPKTECRWAGGPIKIDGVLNEPAWQKAELIDNFMVSWQKRKPKTATKARLLWDNDYLYFAGAMEDTDLYADIKQPNGMCWLNDVFELFFQPDDKKLAYYEFQVNAANTPLQMFLPSRGAGGYQRFAPITPVTLESAVKLDGTLNDYTDKDKGWTVEGRIPWSAFKATGGRPKAGDRWRFALCRYDYSVGFDQPETSTSAPLTQANFHRYEDYAELVFVGP
jgi:Carbohydrate family 9 binding domain-like